MINRTFIKVKAKRSMSRPTWFIFLFLLQATFLSLQGQPIRVTKSSRFQSYADIPDGNRLPKYQIKSKDEITSLAIQFEGELEGTYLLVQGTKYYLQKDEHHGEKTELYKFSNLVIFEKPIEELVLFPGKSLKGPARLILHHVPVLPKRATRHTTTDECSLPIITSQESWRSGLPPPSFSRRFSTTRHVIVHHSATSNNLIDYPNVVRNIYIFHTQTRGWSDIGYNYLIDPAGEVYAGRDPANGDQDLVVGAHFCGSNSHTTGICLLGNFSQESPSPKALESLQALVSWKVEKDQLDPQGSRAHPLNRRLPVIAGHRDGCSTECPGNFTYPLLPQLRDDVVRQVEDCQEEKVLPPSFSFGPNPNPTDILLVTLPEGVSKENLSFVGLNGQKMEASSLSEEGQVLRIDISGWRAGSYILRVEKNDFRVIQRIVRL